MKEQAESFHLNGHIIEFRPQTQKLESPYNDSIKHPGSERVNDIAVKPIINQRQKYTLP